VTLGSASLTIHTALLLLLAPLPFLVATDDREATVAAAWEPDELEIRPEICDAKPVEEPEEPAAIAPISIRESEFREVLGDVGFCTDGPFEGPSTNAAIGIGGGAGGAFGGRGGRRNLKAMGGGLVPKSNLLVIERADDEEPPEWRGRRITEGILFAERVAGLDRFPLAGTEVKARISTFLASVSVAQRFANPFAKNVEAIYVFPLPRRSAVCDFVLRVGGREIRGMIRRKEEAREIYEEAKRAGHTAALLTQERPNIFIQRVANLESGRPVEVEIEYFHPVRATREGFEFVFPMVVAPRYTPAGSREEPAAGARPTAYRPSHDVSLSVSLDAGVPIEEISCPTHSVRLTRPSPSRAEVTLVRGAAVRNRDFVLRYRVSSDEPRFAALAHRGRNGGFFSLVLTPAAKVTRENAAAREIVFLLDCSGSMRGAPLSKSKAVVRRLLRDLSPWDEFRVLRFSESASALSPEPLRATPENVEAALRYVAGLSGRGGTRMTAGITAALGPEIENGRARQVCFLTDGHIGNEREVLALIRKLRRNARLYSFGVGSSVNRYLLDMLAEIGHGHVQYVLPSDRAEEAAECFHRRMEKPQLTDLTVDFGGLPVKGVYPERIPDIVEGMPLVLVGRYRGGGSARITIRGFAGRTPFVHEVPLDLPEWREEHAVLGPVWARTRIGALMHRDLGPISAETERVVTELALRFRLLSPFTAFVAVDRSHVADGECTTVTVPLPMPDGVSYRGVFGTEGEHFELVPLGMQMTREEHGLRVTRVAVGSAAETAGFASGDVVLTLNGKLVRSGHEAEALLRDDREGVTLALRRDGERRVVRFTPSER